MTGAASLVSGGGGAPTFGAAGAGASEEADAGGTTDVAYPAGIVAGGTLLLHCIAFNGTGTPTISTPAGWTLIGTHVTVDTLYRVSAFMIRSTGSESGSLTVTHGGTALFLGRMYRYTRSSGAEDADSASTDASGTAMDAVDVTTLGPARRAIQLFFAAVNTTIGNITGESGADYTEAVAEFAYNGTGALDGILSIQDASVSLPAAITGGSAALAAAGTNRVRIGFALKP